jgi:hypothetical protein
MASRKDCAAALGVTPQTLAEFWKKPAAWFPLSAVSTDARGRAIDWDVERIQAARKTATAGNENALAQKRQQIEVAIKAEQLKKHQLTTRDLQRDHDLAEGNILTRDEYTLFSREVITIARDQIKDIPKQLARLADGEALQNKMINEGTRLVAGILKRLAESLNDGPRD